jgi:site-specific DNA-cytosine methylase
MPPRVAEALGRAVQAENVKPAQGHPRPSEVFKAVIGVASGADVKWVELHRADVLAAARDSLRGQPTTPLTPGPKRRSVDGQVVEGKPLASEAFTGGGLFALACAIEGVHATEICEIDKWAIETLKVNLDASAVSRDALEWAPSVPDGGLDLLLGGPPCQPFSKGASLGQSDYGVASAKNMYPRILDWIADAQPRVVVMENSSEVATKPDYRDYFQWWWRQVNVLGYEGVFWVLDASSFGTPQARKRAIAVAWPRGAPWGQALKATPQPTHGDPGSPAVKSGALLPWTHAFDRLASGCCGGYGLVGCLNLGNLNGRCSSCIEGEHFELAPNGSGEQARLPIDAATFKTYAGMFDAEHARVSKRRPTPASEENAFRPRDKVERMVAEWLSPTLLADSGSRRKQEMLLIPETGTGTVSSIDTHDKKQREAFVAQLEIMSVREAAKLQDVPMWWAYSGSRRAAWMQIGNGIPVNLGRTVIRRVLTALGYPDPIPGSMAAGTFEGLWPLDAVDMCARSVGVEGYPDMAGGDLDEHGPTWKATLTAAERRRRPHVNLQAATASRSKRTILQERQTWWEDVDMDGVWSPNWEKILDEKKGWTPRSVSDLPPGFLSHPELLMMLENEDEVTRDLVIAMYAHAVRVSPQKALDLLWAQEQKATWL